MSAEYQKSADGIFEKGLLSTALALCEIKVGRNTT